MKKEIKTHAPKSAPSRPQSKRGPTDMDSTVDRMDNSEGELGRVVGSATGEADRDALPGGWEGTDDATSTSPSDLAFTRPDGSDASGEPDREIDRLWEESKITGATIPEDEL